MFEIFKFRLEDLPFAGKAALFSTPLYGAAMAITTWCLW